MKVYKIKVNGKSYKVEVESITEEASAPVSETKTEAAPAAAPVASASGDFNKVESPIQGTVVNVKVKVGDNVKKGDVLLIVEAMKLENDVVSPFSGEVAEVLVTKGQNVAAKDVVVTIK